MSRLRFLDLQTLQDTFCFVALFCGFGKLLTGAFDDMRRRTIDKFLILQLTLTGRYKLIELGELLSQSSLFGFNVDAAGEIQIERPQRRDCSRESVSRISAERLEATESGKGAESICACWKNLCNRLLETI